jgi:K+-transporting ATPase ATPase C chain
MLAQIVPSIRATIVLGLFTGLLFPLAITGLSQLMFPGQANGSLIRDSSNRIIGSQLIGQNFTQPKYFHPRPSAAGSGYAGEASSGTNLGPTSAKLINGLPDDPATKDVDESYAGIKQLAEQYRKDNNMRSDEAVPVDAVTRSSSGLDPDISLANALLQARRVAQARSLPKEVVEDKVKHSVEQRTFGFIGEPRVNVLTLNLALDTKKD